MTNAAVLNSWKEIASYLGRGVRTLQRWERDSGLPVHRPKGSDRSAVLALQEELDAWLHRTPVRNGNGNEENGHAAEDHGRVMLELARDLLAQGERLVMLDYRRRTEAEKLVQAVREVVCELAAIVPENGAVNLPPPAMISLKTRK